MSDQEISTSAADIKAAATVNDFIPHDYRADMPPPTQRDLAGCVLEEFTDGDADLNLGVLTQLCIKHGVTDVAETERLVEMLARAERGVDLSLLLGPPPPANPHRSLADWARLPELTFHDAAKILPNYAEGCVGILFGERSSHKTNVALSLLFEAMERNPNLRVLYLAGEGAAGVGQKRIPAHIAASNDPLALAWAAKRFRKDIAFEHRLYLHGRLPCIMHPEEVAATIKEFGLIKPNIVVIDTLATAIAGYDENSSEVSAMLTGNGTVAQIVRAWNCMVLIIAHSGKDASKGVRGHSGMEGNADFVLETDADKDARTIRLKVRKMRDGEDGFSTYYRYDAGGVPVPVKISEAEYLGMVKPRSSDGGSVSAQTLVPGVLRRHGCIDRGHGIETPELATFMADNERGPRPGETGEDGVAEWDTCRGKWLRDLNSAKRTAWAKRLFTEECDRGGPDLVLRWFAASVDEDAIPF